MFVSGVSYRNGDEGDLSKTHNNEIEDEKLIFESKEDKDEKGKSFRDYIDDFTFNLIYSDINDISENSPSKEEKSQLSLKSKFAYFIRDVFNLGTGYAITAKIKNKNLEMSEDEIQKINILKDQLQAIEDAKNNKNDDGIKYDGIG